MLLSTIFQALTFGELKQITVGGAGEGGIHPVYTEEILTHLNLGLVSLYTKFPLREKEVNILTTVGKITYLLTPSAALSQNPLGYIQDTVEEPFLGDILRIEKAFDELGEELPINDEVNPNAISIPSYDSVRLPQSVEGELYCVVYRSRPLSIEVPEGVDPTEVDIPLPELLLEPLLMYISGRVQCGKAGGEGKNEGMLALQKYEKMCKDLELRNVFNSSHVNSNEKLDENGWA